MSYAVRFPDPELTVEPELYQPPQLLPKVEDEPEASNRTTEDLHAMASLATHVLLLDVKALKNPVTHVSHLGWVVAVPDTSVYLPGAHLVWAVQESFAVPRVDLRLLKNPDGHVSHVGSDVAEASGLVYLPGGHSVWYAVQESFTVPYFDLKLLKNPGAHVSHLGSEVVLPAVLVYLPAGHLVCAVQE